MGGALAAADVATAHMADQLTHDKYDVRYCATGSKGAPGNLHPAHPLLIFGGRQENSGTADLPDHSPRSRNLRTRTLYPQPQ